MTQRLRDLGEKAKRLTLQLGELEAQQAPSFSAEDEELTAIREVLREIITDRSDIKRTRVLLQQLIERSEEHTSELESLMRISYAVFCLKKKKIQAHVDLSKHNNTR